MRVSIKKWLLGGVAASVMIPVMPAMAQEDQAAATDQGQEEVQLRSEIVVTARRRQESILKVPVVAHVMEAKQLQQYAVSDLASVASHMPGMRIGSSTSVFGSQVAIRGIGTTTMNATVDQSVSLNIDGMQLTQGLAYGMAFFDMAHVEVLKGPQALFFGKASPAGVISVGTADPTDEFEATVRTSYEFEAKQKQVEAIVSGPLSDVLKLRLAGSYSDADGFFRNRGVAGDLGDYTDVVPGMSSMNALLPMLAGMAPGTTLDSIYADKFGAIGSMGGVDSSHSRVPEAKNRLFRATAIWEPSDDFRARLKFNYAKQRMEGAGFDVQPGSCPEGTAPQSSQAPIRFVNPAENCKVDRNTYVIDVDPAAFPGVPGVIPGVYNNGVPFTEGKQMFGTLDLSYKFNPSLTLSSLTGLYHLRQSSTINGSASSYAGPAFMVQGDYGRDDFTQEVRLTTDNSGPWNFMLGGFYQSGDQNFLVELPSNLELSNLYAFTGALGGALTALGPLLATMPNPYTDPSGFGTWQAANQATFAGALNGIIGTPNSAFVALPPALGYARHIVKTESWAAFGQALWKVLPKVEVGVGARYTDETRTHRQIDPITGSVADLAVPRINSKNWSPEISVTYTPTDDLTVFGSWKQAYKSGSFVTSGVFYPGDDASFHDERVRGFEAGIKGNLFDRALNFTLAGYYYKYKGLQLGSNEVSGGGYNYIIYTRNAGSAKSYGADLDLNYRPYWAEGLTLKAAANYNISKYTSFHNAPCSGGQTIEQGCNITEDGTVLADGYLGPDVGIHQDLTGRSLMRAPKWSLDFGADYRREIGGGMTLGLGASTQYTSDLYTNILLRDDMRQNGYWKTNASISLQGPNDAWELAVIGNNVFNKIAKATCVNTNLTDGSSKLKEHVTGVSVDNPDYDGDTEELLCSADQGRGVTVRLTMKLSELFR